jgi:hypothetical protein
MLEAAGFTDVHVAERVDPANSLYIVRTAP